MPDSDADEFQFTPDEDGSLSIESAVFQALGAASVCWENIDRSGVFESDRAKGIGHALLKRIDTECINRQPQALLGLAATRELLEEISSRMRDVERHVGCRVLARTCEDALEWFEPAVLDYRTVNP